MTQTPDLVIFDFDGVLVDSETISARMLVAALADYGVAIDEPYVARHFLGRSYPVVLARIREEFAVALPEGFEAEYRAALLAAFRRELRAMPGAAEALERLALPCCIATSSSPARVAETLEISGLARFFSGRVTTASEVAQGKPAPDLFLLAAARAGVAPERCLVIEDSGPGLLAAAAAGMPAWHFTGGSHFAAGLPPLPAGARPERRIASFAEFCDAVASFTEIDTPDDPPRA
ncbi:HAD family hydrolase [Roseivivax sp. CAU 1761]